MSARLLLIGGALAASLVAGTVRDRAAAASRVTLNGYHVLATDFHVHTHPLSTSTLAPWDVVVQAQRVHLDAIAVTPHNHVWPAKVARWFSRLEDGPIVLVGEEIAVGGTVGRPVEGARAFQASVRSHLLVVGIERPIAWGRSAAVTIDEAHAQGGIAIAAHPIGDWPDTARRDRAAGWLEIVHPVGFGCDKCAEQLRAFNARAAALPSAIPTHTASASSSRASTSSRGSLGGEYSRAVRAGPPSFTIAAAPTPTRRSCRLRSAWTPAANGAPTSAAARHRRRRHRIAPCSPQFSSAFAPPLQSRQPSRSRKDCGPRSGPDP